MQARATYQWDKVRLCLHFAFASCVIIQLLSSLEMRRPYRGHDITTFEATAFRIHSYSGVTATLLVLAYWFWIIFYSRQTLKHLFPFLSHEGLKEILSDLIGLLHFKLPNAALAGGLPGFVQGLGLLLVSFVGLCGSFLFFTLPDTHSVPPLIDLVKETHGFFAPWMWWYLGGHLGMATLHRFISYRNSL